MKKKLLIVDDQPGIRLLLTDVFTEEGYQIETAKTGQEAIEKMLAQTFDLILLDYRLPILDGKQVMQKMKQAQLDVPVILMSGLIEEIDKTLDRGNMIIKTIEKPFSINDIRKLAKKLIV